MMPYEDKMQDRRQAGPKRPHNLMMEGRGKLTLSGVDEVESFDEREIVMRTGEGTLYIAGEGLSVSRLSVDSGDVNVQGRVSELRYEETAERRGLFGRLFH